MFGGSSTPWNGPHDNQTKLERTGTLLFGMNIVVTLYDYNSPYNYSISIQYIGSMIACVDY